MCLHLSIPAYAEDWDRKYGEFFFYIVILFIALIYSIISTLKILDKEEHRWLPAYLFVFSVLIYGGYSYINIIIIKNENGFYNLNAKSIKAHIFSIWGVIDLIIMTGIFFNIRYLIEYLMRKLKQTIK